MSDERKLAGVVNVAAGAIMAFVFGGVIATSNDPQLLEEIPKLHTIGFVGATIGAAILVLGILVLAGVRPAAMISIGVYAAIALFSIYASASDYLGSGRKSAGYVLTIAALGGAVVQYRAWKSRS